MTEALRIAVFVHEFPALSETFVLNQITGLIDRGCDVTIFANGRRAESVEHDAIARYDLTRRTRYLAMPANRLARLAEAGRLIARYRGRLPAPLLRALNVVRYRREALSLALFFWAVRLLEGQSRFDVIYCHFGTIGRTAARLREIGALHGPLVTAFHGVDVSASLRRSPDIYRELFAQGELFLPVSRHWASRLQVHGCDPERIAVHHMGVDTERFAYRRREPSSDGTIRLLSVGRLVEKKGITHALRAVALVHGQGIRLRYDVIGDGPLRRRLEMQAAELGIRHIVNFHGWRDQDEVAARMYASDILLAPSVTDSIGDQEGIPVTLMEAMATGMPVVSSVHSGIPELVRHGETGFLAAEGDVAALADAIGRLARDPLLRERMGRAGRAIVCSEFNAQTLDRRLMRLLQLAARAGLRNEAAARETLYSTRHAMEHVAGAVRNRRS